MFDSRGIRSTEHAKIQKFYLNNFYAAVILFLNVRDLEVNLSVVTEIS